MDINEIVVSSNEIEIEIYSEEEISKETYSHDSDNYDK